MFKQLLAKRASIEETLKAKLQWNKLPDGRACHILQVRPDAPLEDEAK